MQLLTFIKQTILLIEIFCLHSSLVDIIDLEKGSIIF